MKESQIEKARRAIVRIARSEEEAQILVREMASTEWEQVFAKNSISCQRCKQPVRYALVFKDVNGVGNYCETCYNTPVKRYCYICERSSPGHISVMGCDKCYTFPCIACQKPHLFLQDLSFLKLCPSCKAIGATMKELKKLNVHLERTNEINRPDALTLAEWLRTLRDFNRMCAYCLAHPYEHLEHFIPVEKGGRTTVSNCVPSCGGCNYLKHRMHPDYVTGIPQEDLIRVFLYLETR